jgi:hypothetical protein
MLLLVLLLLFTLYVCHGISSDAGDDGGNIDCPGLIFNNYSPKAR